ncbi:hypothetical protein, variant 1 [Allomyces macrogynus ATCC 38327]|uniref:Kaptin n=1 Tax=Allomyces macrogynus (strain ATCC 38327) TaxID=578462 RepID=A0A0L0RVD7_ALLM3|nr:hypothetical protein, variant 1 [Allomyces macrogynus ATCC 38327]|eukprot:KNE54278.1 hypothetical protein, variant 1 [Allomyces macrogynus ATCC 38327]
MQSLDHQRLGDARGRLRANIRMTVADAGPAAIPSIAVTPPSRPRRRRVRFPLHEVHVARFGSFARATAYSACALASAAPCNVALTPMHPAFVYTAPSSAATASGSASALAAVSPSFQPISCHVSPANPFEAVPTSMSLPSALPSEGATDDAPARRPSIRSVKSTLAPSSSGQSSPQKLPTLSARSAGSSVYPPLLDPDTPVHIVTGSSNNHLLCLLVSSTGAYWNTVEVPLTQIPDKGEILGLHAFERATTFHFFDIVSGHMKASPSVGAAAVAKRSTALTNLIVAVTIIQESETGPKYSLHIYGARTVETTLERKLFALAADCQIIPLDYAPLHVSHLEYAAYGTSSRMGAHLFRRFTRIADEGKEVMAIAVCDEDGFIHVYTEVPSTRKFVEIEGIPPPASSDPPSAAMFTSSLEAQVNDQSVRFTVIAYGSGQLTVTLDWRDSETHHFDPSRRRVLSEPLCFTPITSVTWFEDAGRVHLLVSPACEPAFVLLNVSQLAAGEDKDTTSLTATCSRATLPLSDRFDSVVSAAVGNVLWNGSTQIVLGTYGQRLLLYDWDKETSLFHLVSMNKTAYPVLALYLTDINHDGVLELIAVSLFGIHVYQHDLDHVRARVEARLGLPVARAGEEEEDQPVLDQDVEDGTEMDAEVDGDSED